MDYSEIKRAEAENDGADWQDITLIWGDGQRTPAKIRRADAVAIGVAIAMGAADLRDADGGACIERNAGGFCYCESGADMAAAADGYATLPCDGDCGRGGAIRHDRDACNAAYNQAGKTLDPPPRYDAVYRAAVERMDADERRERESESADAGNPLCQFCGAADACDYCQHGDANALRRLRAAHPNIDMALASLESAESERGACIERNAGGFCYCESGADSAARGKRRQLPMDGFGGQCATCGKWSYLTHGNTCVDAENCQRRRINP